MAALWSRSSRVPQVSQANSRSARVSFGFHRTARRAGLAGGVPPVSDEDAHCGVGGLVLDLVPELAHAQPADVPGQAPVADHPGDVQVLTTITSCSATRRVVSLCSPSRRWFAMRVYSVVTRVVALRHRLDGSMWVRRSGPRRREQVR